MSDKNQILKLSRARAAHYGIIRTTDDGGKTWEFHTVGLNGYRNEITEGEYNYLKGDLQEVKSHEPATDNYSNIYGYSVKF